MADELQQWLAARAESACRWSDPQRDALLGGIREHYGSNLAAVLIYGSYLRGKRDTLLDFYVLLDSYRLWRPRWQAALAWLLSPNVYQAVAGKPPDEVRAKYAVMTLGRFARAVRHDFHPYFWARFAQPCGLLYCRDERVRRRVAAALADAGRHFVRRVVPRLGRIFDAAGLAVGGFRLTYACELRTEGAGRAEALYAHGSDHFEELVRALAGQGLGYVAAGSGRYRNRTPMLRCRLAAAGWLLRRAWGKPKSLLRLLKAALTFDGGFDYLLWKIRRHSGQYIEPTERQRRHPLLFGWPLLWRLYRRGAFR